jgi:hypothetical protein
MTNTRLTTVLREARNLAPVVVLFVAVTACTTSSDDTEPGPRPTASSSDTASPSETVVASDAAATIVRTYYPTVDALRQDPERAAQELESVTASTQLAAQKKLLESQRKQRLHQVGNTKIIKLETRSISLDNSDPAAGKVPTAIVDVCWDVSSVDVVDDSGESVVTPDRAAIGWTRFSVANYDWPSNPADGWRVAGGEDLKKAPCDAS